jgi:peptidoglycan hydrolase CwlO-like protein
MNAEDRERILAQQKERVRLGNEFEKWKQHECTQLFLEKLQKRAEDSRESLTEVGPTDTTRIMELQSDVKAFKGAIAEIHAAIQDRQNALHEIHQLDNMPVD